MRSGYSGTRRARSLRAAATAAEKCLWGALRGAQLGWSFRRQHPIPPYIVDFACIGARLIVEVDGGQHGGSADSARDNFLHRRGWRVLRFWNNDVLQNRDAVVQVILLELPPIQAPTSTLPRRRGREGPA